MAQATGMVIPPINITKKAKMFWSREKDDVLCRQALAERPYQFKKWSTQLTDTWQVISESLTVLDGFKLATTKGIREHFDKIIDNRRKERNAEKLLSGVEIDENEWTKLTDGLLEDMDGCAATLEEQTEMKKAAAAKENAKAENTRKAAMESWSESKKRNAASGSVDDDLSPRSSKRQRTSGTETVRFLMEKQGFIREQHEAEINLRKEELEIRKKEVENNSTLMSQMVQQLNQAQQQNVQQLQIQQQQSLQQMQMQQQQMELMRAMLEKFKN